MPSPEMAVSSLDDFLRVLFRHKRKVVGSFMLAALVVVLGLLLLPRKYESEARLFVRVGRETVSLDPTASTGPMIAMQDTREREVRSVIDILKSRVLMEQVADALGVDTILKGNDPLEQLEGDADEDATAALRAKALTLAAQLKTQSPEEEGEIERRDKAVATLIKSTLVKSERGSSVISIACRAGSPELAQRVCEAYLEAFKDRYMAANRTAGSREFFSEQVQLLQKQLAEATRTLRDAKNKSGLITIAGQRELVQGQMGLIETDILGNQSTMASSQARIASLREKLTRIPERMTTAEESGFDNVVADNLRSQLYRLQILERELSSKFTEDHPRVSTIRRQLTEAKKLVDAEGDTRTRVVSNVNPAHQQLHVAFLNEQALLDSYEARAKALAAEHREVTQKLEKLNAEEILIADLEREVGLLEMKYKTYTDKLEEARIGLALHSERISNVNIVQPPAYLTKAVSPKTVQLAVLGLFAALCGGVGVALVSEYLDTTFRTPEAVETQLEMPVLLTVPRISRHRVSLN